ncbi:hypothetical protein [Euzebya tangerina]|uniref:hypothetical protein n=1 Tax=Euzebya tangerina TaxID=591198 RepID=UPI000E313236|nr:hypothetical protein [Euzebya tangerina]
MRREALPVAVRLADQVLLAEVTAYVEAHLGWQVVDHGPHLPARLCLADRPQPDLPTIAVAVPGTDPRPLLRAGVRDVVLWPDEQGRLADLVPDDPVGRPADQVVVVAGLASRVGTTTVALALGACAAWRGRRVVVATSTHGRALVGPLEAGAVPGVGEVPGIPGLAVQVGLGTPPGPSSLSGTGSPPRPHLMVVDRGVSTGAHIAVAVPDRLCAEQIEQLTPSCTLVLRGRGGLREAEIRRLFDGRSGVVLEESFRVARAGFQRRVPIGLPGRYVDGVTEALGSATGAIAPRTAAA